MTRGRRLRLAVVAAALLFVFSISTLVRLYTDALWYGEVGFRAVFWRVLGTQAALVTALGLAFFIFCLANLYLVGRLMPPYTIAADPEDPVQRYRAAALPYLKWMAIGGSALLGLLFGLGTAPVWDRVLMAMNAVPFGSVDPVFGKDIGFFIFKLPLYRFLYGWTFSVLVVVTLIVVGAHYLSGGIRPQASGGRVTPQVKVHLSVLLGLIAVLRAWGYRLDQFQLLYSPRGDVTGASFTDVNAELPALKLLVVISIIGALLFLVNIRFKGWVLPAAGAGLWLLTSVLAAGLYPFIIQRFTVDPSPLRKEAPFLARHIKATRAAYGLDGIDIREYSPTGEISKDAVEASPGTIENIRLWDPSTLQRAYRQLQEIRPYYQFEDVDVDRYMVNGRLKQVMLSVRELDTNYLIQNQGWQNQHLFYTHGYGAVVSGSGDTAGAGEPSFLVKNIPPAAEADVFKLERPGVYYGEGMAGVYSLAPSGQRELDFGREQGNQFTRYSGDGGVPLQGLVRRLAFAWRFRNINLAISGLIEKDTKVLYYRQVRERLLKAAPFLHFDSDPYPVIVDGRIVWMADGYTASPMYPYSARIDFASRTSRDTSLGPLTAVPGVNNYVRNSVKATIDSHDGTVNLYVWDAKDPMVRMWERAFPGVLRPAADMPESLKGHVRYPEDLFRIQSFVYQRYHMTNPTDFFTSEDLWVIPSDPNQRGGPPGQGQEMRPYYVLMRLPEAEHEEYVLIMPMNPRGKRNMISWVAAKSGPEDYGKLLDYRFPKGSQVDGVGQVRARIDSDSEIARVVSLLDQRGSQVVWGNLLVIPIDNSILYVQPMFVQAENNAIPELRNVILATDSKIVMTPTLSRSLAQLLGEEAGPEPEPGPGGAPPSGAGPEERITRALEHLSAADEAARRGDWAAYGRELEAAKRILREGEPVSSETPSPAA